MSLATSGPSTFDASSLIHHPRGLKPGHATNYVGDISGATVTVKAARVSNRPSLMSPHDITGAHSMTLHRALERNRGKDSRFDIEDIPGTSSSAPKRSPGVPRWEDIEIIRTRG